MKKPDRAAVQKIDMNKEPKSGLQFDAQTKELKATIEELITDVGVGKSEFFAFVLSEAIRVLESIG